MERRKFTRAMLTVPSLWMLGLHAHAQFTETDAASGVRLTLERGVTAAVGLLGRKDGFLANPKVHIPLPGVLDDAAKILRAVGQQKKVDELVTAMNRAAEAAVPEAKYLLVNAVKSMSVEDAKNIVSGGVNSVTDFFVAKTRIPLGEKFRPIVTRQTEKLAVAEKYNTLAERAARFGLIKQRDADIQTYVTEKTLDGLYLIVGEEERKIRNDPIGTGSAILKRIFGSGR